MNDPVGIGSWQGGTADEIARFVEWYKIARKESPSDYPNTLHPDEWWGEFAGWRASEGDEEEEEDDLEEEEEFEDEEEEEEVDD